MTLNAPDGNVSYYDHMAEHYSLFFQNLESNMELEGSWLDAVLSRLGAHRILDASCGTGRQSVPLCQRGYDVIAVDPSEGMLRHAQQTAVQHGVPLHLIHADFSHLCEFVGADFDAVIALGNGLCHLTDLAEIQRALENMRSCCRPGGTCMVGIKDFDAVCRTRLRLHGRQVQDTSDRRRILFEVWDYDDPILACTAYVIDMPRVPGPWQTDSATTHEYMLSSALLHDTALHAGFRSVHRLDHPAEAVYALQT